MIKKVNKNINNELTMQLYMVRQKVQHGKLYYMVFFFGLASIAYNLQRDYTFLIIWNEIYNYNNM